MELPSDLGYEILLNSSYEDMYNLCDTSRYFRSICQSPEFKEARLQVDAPNAAMQVDEILSAAKYATTQISDICDDHGNRVSYNTSGDTMGIYLGRFYCWESDDDGSMEEEAREVLQSIRDDVIQYDMGYFSMEFIGFSEEEEWFDHKVNPAIYLRFRDRRLLNEVLRILPTL